MPTKQLKAMIDSFTSTSAVASERMKNLLSIISEGKAPEAEDVGAVNATISELQEQYEKIYAFAASHVPETEMPDKGLSVATYLNAVEESLFQALQNQLAAAKELLGKFVKVKSLVEEYTKALKPYQEEAQDLLGRLSAGGETLSPDMLPNTSAQKAFMQALNADSRSPSGIMLLREVSRYYPLEVQWGLSAHVYAYDEGDTAEAQTGAFDEAVVDAGKEGDISVAAVKPEPAENLTADVSEVIGEDAGGSAETSEKDDEKAPIFADVNEAGSLAADKKNKDLLTATNKVKIDPPGASAFKKAILNLEKSYPGVLLILPILTNLGIMTDDQISRICVKFSKWEESEVKAAIQRALDVLCSKGYLARFEYKEGNNSVNAFCLSQYCYGSMMKESIANAGFWVIDYGSFGFYVHDTVDKSFAQRIVSINQALVLYLCDMRKCCNKDQFRSILSSLRWCGSYYSVALYYKEAQYAANVFNVWADYSTAKYRNLLIVYEEELRGKVNLDDLATAFEKVFIYKAKAMELYCPKEPPEAGENGEDASNVAAGGELVPSGGAEEEAADTQGVEENLEEHPDAAGDDGTVAPVGAEEEVTGAQSREESLEDASDAVAGPEQVASVGAEEEATGAQSGEENLEDVLGAAVDAAPAVAGSIEGIATDSQNGTGEDANTEVACSLAPAGTELEQANGATQASDDPEQAPSDEEFCERIRSLLGRSVATSDELKENIVNAVMLAKAASYIDGYEASEKLSGQLQLATFIPLGEGVYTSQALSKYFDRFETEDQCLLYGAYAFAMLAPAKPYDYALKNQVEKLKAKYENIFPDLAMFKALFITLRQVQNIVPTGFTPSAIALLGTNEENEQYASELKQEAQLYMTVIPPKARLKALPSMYRACFGNGSDLYSCMEIIADNKREEKESVELILADYCYGQDSADALDEDRIELKLSTAWEAANPKRTFKLEYDAHAQAMRQFNLRLTLMKNWVDHINSLEKKDEVEKLKALKARVVKEIEELLQFKAWREIRNANVLEWALNRIKAYLNDKNSALEIFSGLLSTGIISLADDGYPVLDRALQDVKYYEPWRNVLKHINAPRKTFPDIRVEILSEYKSELFDNLRQLAMIGKYLKDGGSDYQITVEHEKQAAKAAENRTLIFREHLEMAYTYNQINETEKETLLGIMDKFREQFFELKDFACWRQFLAALNRQVEKYTADRQKRLVASLNLRLEKAPDSALLAQAEQLIMKDKNFAVAEERINEFDAGKTELPEDIDAVLHEVDYFSDFLSKDKFEPLYGECNRNRNSGKSVSNFGVSYFKNYVTKNWATRLEKDSIKLLKDWPSRKNWSSLDQIQSLFTSLGFYVTNVEKQDGRKEEAYKLYVKPTDKSKADYLHPISAFGTQVKSPINVVVLYGTRSGKELVDTMTQLDLKGITIVLSDNAFDIAERRQVAEIFHRQTSGQNAFLLIDRVLIMYLAFLQSTERLPALLKCTLPYTTYQPFVRDGGSTADEMFCGRKTELKTILDPNGACVVYGGRQLGKTALLERAESRFSQPGNNIYAVYTTIINASSEVDFVEKVVGDIELKTDGKIVFQNCQTISSLCEQLRRMFRNHEISGMLLLIDEADNFLASISQNSYKELQPLIDLKRETQNNFKFVLAGLHNVCRAKKATEKNGVFGQLGTPLCVKPLSPTDALQLLSKPLKYLGFQIDRYPHLETILTNTNYYPGILQFFGYRLVETLTEDYRRYYSATDGNPPFTLRDEQLGAVMNSADLNKSIKDKFRWSLELDERYFMIARCITMRYHYQETERSSSSWLGYSVGEIKEIADMYEIKCLEKETAASYKALLDEMVEMGILSTPSQSTYRLRRSSFVDIIGEDPDALEKEIEACNEAV